MPGYYKYATQSDMNPGNTIFDPGQANYKVGGMYSATQSLSYSSSQNYLTDVGAFSDSASFYGTFDQSGNVSQWNDLDGLASSGSSGQRGGDWTRNDPYFLSSSLRFVVNPDYQDNFIGFRLASPASSPSSVPEIDPATGGSALSLVAGVLAMIEQRRRRRGTSIALTA